ncbi:MAG: energy coupling factor transporter S component ThiW [Clostridiales bacterium]|nr:energy coupling factor transporter S component ThiW [Clostridiales bacterium]
MMRKEAIKKTALAGIMIAVAVVGSLFSFPILGSRCAPVQHLVNIICAVFLGPWYGLAVAFIASLIRVLLSLGTPLAFPGSMFGALLSGLLYSKFKKIPLAVIGEVFGTAVIGGLCAYPVAILVMGKDAGEIAFYAYVVPFLISTAGGAVIASVILLALHKTGIIKKFRGE